jgi:hypothetical protein
MIVRSSKAHAWTEVLLPEKGWIRVDPTSAVSPERIESGLGASLSAAERPEHLFRGGLALRYRVEMAWDLINAGWDRWFLAYGPELQRDFLSRFGLPDLRAIILALTGTLTAMLALIGAFLLWQARPRGVRDPVLAAWLRFCRTLERAGIERRHDEGPQDFAARAAAAHPRQDVTIRRIAALYAALRYREAGDGETHRRFLREARGFSVVSG